MDISALQAKLERLKASGRSSSDYWTPDEGEHTIRILPPTNGGTVPFKDGGLHRNLGADGKTSRVCPRLLKAGECPACALHDELVRSKDASDQALAKRIAPIERTYFAILVRETGEFRIYGAPPTVAQRIVELLIDQNEYGDITDPEKGLDLKLTREGKTLTSTKYSLLPKRRESPIGVLNWKEQVPNLEERVKASSAETIANDLEQMLGAAVSDAPTPATPVQAPPAQRPPVQAPPQESAPAVQTPPAAPAVEQQSGKPECYCQNMYDEAECKGCQFEPDCNPKPVEEKPKRQRRAASTPAATTTPTEQTTPTTPPTTTGAGLSEDMQKKLAEMQARIKASSNKQS